MAPYEHLRFSSSIDGDNCLQLCVQAIPLVFEIGKPKFQLIPDTQFFVASIRTLKIV